MMASTPPPSKAVTGTQGLAPHDAQALRSFENTGNKGSFTDVAERVKREFEKNLLLTSQLGKRGSSGLGSKASLEQGSDLYGESVYGSPSSVFL